jgi:hypothetical protein
MIELSTKAELVRACSGKWRGYELIWWYRNKYWCYPVRYTKKRAAMG